MSSSSPDNLAPPITVTRSTPPPPTKADPISNPSDTIEQVEAVKKARTIGQVATAYTGAASQQPDATDNENKKTLLERIMGLEKTIAHLQRARILLAEDMECTLRRLARDLNAISEELKAVKSQCTEHFESVTVEKEKLVKFVLGDKAKEMAGASVMTEGAEKRKHSELSVVEEDSKGEAEEEERSAKYSKVRE